MTFLHENELWGKSVCLYILHTENKSHGVATEIVYAALRVIRRQANKLSSTYKTKNNL